MENTSNSASSTIRIPGIKARPDGTFTVDTVKCVGGQRVHIYSSGYATLEEALEAMPKLVEAKTAYHSRQSKVHMSFQEFYKRFETYRLLHVRGSSVRFGRSVVRVYLSQWHSSSIEETLTYQNMKQVYEVILKKPCSPEWKNRAFGVMRQMAFTAFKWKLIDAESYQDAMSIYENIPENRGARKEKHIWKASEQKKFLSVIEDPIDKVTFTLFLALGARIGEFVGLTWDCFDARKGTITIKQQLIYDDKGTWVLSPQLKTQESYRVCKLSSQMVEMLVTYRNSTSAEGFMFTARYGGKMPFSKSCFRRKFYQYIEKAGVSRVTPHAIRHGMATELMKVCKNMSEAKAAARFLGHSATMMIDTYGHSDSHVTDTILKRLQKKEETVELGLPTDSQL